MPSAGWPLLVLLDGDWIWPLDPPPAALARCAVLLPGHGPDPQAKARRAWDFTPPAPDGKPWADPRRPEWRCGGAGAYLDELRGPMLAWAFAEAPLDPARITLYGHSYGGLFALYALLSAPGVFARIICASPSLWWRDGWMTQRLDTLRDQPPAHPVEVVVMAGSDEQWHPKPADPSDPAGRREGISTRPALDALIARLGSVAHLQARLEMLPGLGHGPALPASARRAVELAASQEG